MMLKQGQKYPRFCLLLVTGFVFLIGACSEQPSQEQGQTPAESRDTRVMQEPVDPETGPDESYLVYVTNEDSNDISVISGSTHEVLATIPVGKRPRGIKVSPDGSRVYVALSGSPKCPPTMDEEICEAMEADKSADGIAEVDTRARTVVRVLPSGSDPEQFDVNWETGRLYVSNEDSHTASILDLTTGELVTSVPTGREPEGVRLSPDGSIVYVTGETDGDITVLDAGDGSELARIPVGRRPRDSVFTSDGETAYVSAEHGFKITIVDVASNSATGEIALPEGSLPMGLVLSNDEETLYVANGRGQTVVAIDLVTNTVTKSVVAGTRPWGLAKSPQGRYLYTANGPSNDVTVIDSESFQVVTRIPAGDSPWGVATGTAP